MEIGLKEQLERWKILAETYLKEDKKVLVKDILDNWYFADIVLVGDDTITLDCYAPMQRIGQRIVLYWAKVTYFDLVKEREK